MSKDILSGVVCKVCHNSEPGAFHVALRKGDLEVLRCDNCGFTFVPPHFRKDVAYTNYKDASVLEQVRRGNDWLKIQRHRLRFEPIQKYQPTGRLFDLGVGWGHFLHTGRLLGYETSGIEISEMPYTYAKEDLDLDVQHIDFFDLDITPGYHDIVTLWDVLEHVDDCDRMIARCHEMLRDEGLLVIQVPQIDSYFARKYKDDWKMISNDHVNYFSKPTITRLLNDSGFDVLEIKSSLELKLFLMYVVFPKIQKFKPKKERKAVNSATRQEYFNKQTDRPQWMLNLMVKVHNLAYNTLSRLNIGEEMVVFARKR